MIFDFICAIIEQMDVLYLLMVLVVILFSMVLHEFMHGVMAYWLGDDTAKVNGRLSFNPMKHIDPFLTILLPMLLAVSSLITGAQLPIFGGAKPVPFRPDRVKGGEWGAALVGAIGPITNFVLAFIFFGVLALVNPSNEILAEFLSLGVTINLGFAIFNMLPIPPLDGSRVLYAVAPEAIRRLMEMIERFGLVFIFLIVIMLSGPLGQFMSAAMSAIIRFFAMIFGVQV